MLNICGYRKKNHSARGVLTIEEGSRVVAHVLSAVETFFLPTFVDSRLSRTAAATAAVCFNPPSEAHVASVAHLLQQTAIEVGTYATSCMVAVPTQSKRWILERVCQSLCFSSICT